jgi:GntR family transcriptional regulator
MAEPMYRQIADDLHRKIESGEIAPGVQMPTETELMEHYGVSRNTVRDAIKLLTSLGLVEIRAGQGTFAARKIIPLVTTLADELQATGGETEAYYTEVLVGGRRPTSSEPGVEIQLASDVVADALRLKTGAQVVSRHQQQFIDGIPWSLQTTFYPMRLVQAGAARLLDPVNIQQGTVRYLAEACGIRQAGYRDSISVRTPDKNEMEFFRLPAAGTIQVVEIFRVGFTEERDRFRLTIIVYAADRSRFIVNVGDIPSRNAADQ